MKCFLGFHWWCGATPYVHLGHWWECGRCGKRKFKYGKFLSALTRQDRGDAMTDTATGRAALSSREAI